MRNFFTAVLALAAGMSVMGAASMPASAAERGHGQFNARPHVMQHVAGPVHQGIRHNGFRNHGFHHRRVFFAAPIIVHRSHDDGCYWLKRKAINTGSRYWWHRYEACRWN